MRILLIGGTKFIGPCVARELVAQGHTVAVFHRGETEHALPEGIMRLHGSRERLPEYLPAFTAFAPDVVVNMILMTEQQAQTFMEVFDGLAQRVVVISSQDVYRAFGRVLGVEQGLPDPVPLTEDAPLREKLYPYRGAEPRADDDPQKFRDEYDKILVERVVMSKPSLPCTVLRLPAVYGPGDYQHRAYSVVQRVEDGRRVMVLDEGEALWRWTHGYVDDIAHAIALAATQERAAGRTYNVGEPDALSLLERSRFIARAAGWTGSFVLVPSGVLPSDLDPTQDVIVDTERIRAELGYTETLSREDAIARTVAWERANPPATRDPALFNYAAEDAAIRDIFHDAAEDASHESVSGTSVPTPR